MAIINCPECNKEISDKSNICIYCGYPLREGHRMYDQVPKKSKRSSLGVVLVFAVILALAIGSLLEDNNEDVDEKSSKTSYAKEIKSDDVSDDVTDDVTDNDTNISDNDIDTSDFISIKKGELVSTDKVEFAVKKMNIAKTIKATGCATCSCDYYDAEDGKVFVDIVMDITNVTTKKMRQDAVLKGVVVYHNDKDDYECAAVVADGNCNFISDTNKYSINPSEELEYHMLAQVPNKVKNSNKSLKGYIFVDDKIYECDLR